MATNYDPVTQLSDQQIQQQQQQAITPNVLKFPYPEDLPRLQTYDYNEKLFTGNHLDAFRYKINSEIWTKEYMKMRYIVANFAGLISKVCADLLFIEPPKILVPDGDQAWLDMLLSENKMRVQHYESATSNSYLGDALFKIRIGSDSPDGDSEPTIIIDQVTPRIYFPVMDANNVKGLPQRQELAWIVTINSNQYLRKEIHTAGHISNQLFRVEGKDGNYVVKEAVKLDILPTKEPLADEIDTGIDRSLLIHIPNWRPTNSHFGLSDYNDLDTLFFAINNRITKVDNVLDKHTDPILAIPEGILDEKGQVRKERLGLFERAEGQDQTGDPTYITWDASLQNAFSQIDKLVEFTFMMSETSPDVLGMGKGMSDSGRALKFKLLRTLAKVQRKQLYYREGIIETMYVAQMLAAQHGIAVEGLKLTKDPVKPEIVWNDGLPKDMTEQVAIEVQRVDAGLTTRESAIMRLDDVDEDTAKQDVTDIDAETKLSMPQSNISSSTSSFGKDSGGGMGKMGNNKSGMDSVADPMTTDKPTV